MRRRRPDRSGGVECAAAADDAECDSAQDEPRAGGEKFDDALDEASCRERAVGLLARREHSRTELTRKLLSRGYGDAVVASALAQLEQEGALADERFTASFIRTRAAKGKGPVRIRAELAQRGIDKVDARATLAGSEIDWAAEAAAVRRKRFGPELPSDRKERARQARFLQYRGFEQRHIDAALSADSEDC